MADNTQLNPASGGDVIKTEDLGPYKLAVSKIYLGSYGVDGGPVGPSNPLPVSITNPTATQGISAAALPLPAGAATSGKQPAPGTAGSPSADVLSIQGVAAMSPLLVNLISSVGAPGFVRLSDGASPQGVPTNPIRTDPVGTTTQPVSGTVSVGNFPATQPVSGSVSVAGTVVTTANLAVAGSAVAAGNPIPVTTVGALPAGTNTIGAVIAQLATGVLYSGTSALTPKYASISASAAGDNSLVAAVAGKKIRILKYTIVASAGTAAKFRSSSGTDLTGPMPLGANSGIGGAFCPVGLFESVAGEGLVLNLSAAVPVSGHLTYVEV